MGCSSSYEKIHSEYSVIMDEDARNARQADVKTSGKRAGAVELFLKKAYAKSDRVESLRSILAFERSRVTFMKFLKEEYYVDHPDLFESVKKILGVRDQPEASISHRLVSGWSLNSDSSRRISAYSSRIRDSSSNSGRSVRKASLSPEELAQYQAVVDDIAKFAFPKFLRSKMFKHWRAEEKGNVYSLSASFIATARSSKGPPASDASPRVSNIVEPAPEVEIEGEAKVSLSPNKRVPDGPPTVSSSGSTSQKRIVFLSKRSKDMSFAEIAFDKMEGDEATRLLGSSTWLSFLITGIESVPIAFSLASADRSRPGFPLVYVNSKFERETGYKRSEIIGMNCRFLQREGITEPEKVSLISTALRNARPISIEITNVRKNRKAFVNLLTMKPIFDQDGVFRYVMCLHVDVSATRISHVMGFEAPTAEAQDNIIKSCEVHYNQSLLDMLPDVINFGGADRPDPATEPQPALSDSQKELPGSGAF